MLVNKIQKLKPIHDSVLVTEMNFQERISYGGIYIPSDNMKNTGIRPRWARVYAVGPDQQEIKEGQWICVAHGRWTRGVKIEDSAGEKTIHRVDNNDILLVSDQRPLDDTMSDKVV